MFGSRRISWLLRERRVSGAVVAVLSVDLLCGLVGFAFNTMWAVFIVVLALGLGCIIANSRQIAKRSPSSLDENSERTK